MFEFKKTKVTYSHFGLLVWFFVLFLVSPLVPHPHGSLLLNLTYSFILLTTIIALSEYRRTMILGLLIGIPAVITNSYTNYQYTYFTDIISLILSSLLIILVIIVVFRKVFMTPTIINLDLIFGSIAIYILLGLLWSTLYAITEFITPGSFSGLANVSHELESYEQLKHHTLLYYSFVTQTTLGYGDITPISAIARNLSAIQAVTGQLYLAVLVSALIGMFLKQKSS